MNKPISFEDQMSLPRFRDAEDAFRFLKNAYGKDLLFQKIEEALDGEKYWYCHLVVDHDSYQKEMRTPAGMLPEAGEGLLGSYQPIEITELGYVHIGA